VKNDIETEERSEIITVYGGKYPSDSVKKKKSPVSYFRMKSEKREHMKHYFFLGSGFTATTRNIGVKISN
jgi:hypothetical protein